MQLICSIAILRASILLEKMTIENIFSSFLSDVFNLLALYCSVTSTINIAGEWKYFVHNLSKHFNKSNDLTFLWIFYNERARSAINVM